MMDGHTGLEHSIQFAKANDLNQGVPATAIAIRPFVVSYGGMMGEEYWYDRTSMENPRLLRYTVFPGRSPFYSSPHRT